MTGSKISDDGDITYAVRLRESIKDIHSRIMDEEERLDLLKSLHQRGICTRDIMAFVHQQGIKRSVNKAWDFATSQKAMSSKIRDAKRSIQLNRRRKSALKKEYLKLVNYKGSKLRKLIKDIKETVDSAPDLIKKKKANKVKIEHLQRVMSEKAYLTNPSASQPTKVPERLREYSDLPVFGTSKDLPTPQVPTGPFICDGRIELNKQELCILSKDPKFSLMEECTESSFKLEMERMFAKNRFNKYNEKLSDGGVRKKEAENAEGPKVIKDIELIKREMWSKVSHRYIYDPFSKVIDFSHRRPTDYKFNARIKLPKPMDVESEFTCELKRREYIKTFKSYTTSRSKEFLKKKKGTENNIINLTPGEKCGLMSLKKRIKSGEIMIMPTDKSGRLSVMSLDQYMQAGRVHTDKDERLEWSDIRYLKNQVNCHMSWLGNITNYATHTDKDRMAANLSVSDLDLPCMRLLVKDHKAWTPESGKAVPTRPVVSGN